MAKDRDGEASGANQSKKPTSGVLDNGDQPPQQHLPHHHHRKAQKPHIVGGGPGSRLHARVPSSKALHKHHALASTTKLTRAISPERGNGVAHHRRISSQDRLPANSKKNLSHTALRRNRSQVEVTKRTKSSTNLQRSNSNSAVHKLKSKVQFNLGDDEDDQDGEDEWVDASSSASPYLSRRGSAVNTAQTNNLTVGSQDPLRRDSVNSEQTTSNENLARSSSNLNQLLTSKVLSRTPSQGAPPVMSTATVSVQPSAQQLSSQASSPGQGPSYTSTTAAAAQCRPGSSGKAELTSRFVGGNNSQEQGAGSGAAEEAFMMAANRGGLSRAALNGKVGLGMQRRQSSGALSQGRGMDALNARQGGASDSEDEEAALRPRRAAEFIVPRDMNRTQKKLNLQRASSSLEPTHPHPGVGVRPPGVGMGPGASSAFEGRDPRGSKLLERTGMEYLTVRRYLNPVARSLHRVMQLPGLENSRRIPRPGTSHSVRASGSDVDSLRDPSMADLMSGQSRTTSRQSTPRSRAEFSLGVDSASSSYGADNDRLQEQASRAPSQHRLSGSSLVDGVEDAGTIALLRMMWDKTMDLGGSSQD